MVIDKSTFSHLGRCGGGPACAHSVYIGYYGTVTVTRSRFEAGDGGHYLKLRSGRVAITANAFDDSAGHDTNYMIDLAAGASGRIADNWFIALLGILAFIAMAIRTPKEEANLIAKFGDEYREYMKRTGRFLSKVWS